MTEFSIYQINTDRDDNRICFLGLDSVIVVFACPRISDRDLISNPTSTALVAKVWRNV